jgi:hypothetical protein
MSLLFCPECGHEVSASAVACPNCGHPMNVSPPVDEMVASKRVVVAPPPRQSSGLPPWAVVPIGVAAVLLLFFAYLMLRSSGDDGNTNVNVNLAGRRSADVDRDPRTATVPSTTTDIEAATIPDGGYVPPSTSMPSTTSVPGSSAVPAAPEPVSGTVRIIARITPPRSSGTQPVRSTKFYLLDKDLETILAEADVEPIEGNTFAASLGLAAVYPDRYGEFQRAAMRAIARHVKYTGVTDSSGNASLSNVDPKQYYLFGITRVGRGFAMWDAPVSIVAGENVLNLSPQSVVEIPGATG